MTMGMMKEVLSLGLPSSFNFLTPMSSCFDILADESLGSIAANPSADNTGANRVAKFLRVNVSEIIKLLPQNEMNCVLTALMQKKKCRCPQQWQRTACRQLHNSLAKRSCPGRC